MSPTDLVPVIESAAEDLQKEFGVEIVKSAIDKADEQVLKILEKCPGKQFTSRQKKAIAKAVLVLASAVTTFGISAVASVVAGVVSHGSTASVNIAGIPVLAALTKALPYLASSGVARKQAVGTLFAVRKTGADIAMLKQLETFLKTTLLPVLPKTTKRALEKGTEAVAKEEVKNVMKKIFKGKEKLMTEIDKITEVGRRMGVLSEA